MKSHEVFQQLFKKHGVKGLAAALGLAASFLYKWSHSDGGKQAGGTNPLERLLAVIPRVGRFAAAAVVVPAMRGRVCEESCAAVALRRGVAGGE